MSKKVIHAIFDDEEILLQSVKEIRSKKYDIEEVYSPFPVHGLDHAVVVYYQQRNLIFQEKKLLITGDLVVK